MSTSISPQGLAAIAGCLRDRLEETESVVLDQPEIRRLTRSLVVLTPEVVREIASRVCRSLPAILVSGESFIVLEGDAGRALSVILAARSLDAWRRRALTLPAEQGVDSAEIEGRKVTITRHATQH